MNIVHFIVHDRNEIIQGNRMKKSLIFVQNYLFFAYDLTKNIIIGS